MKTKSPIENFVKIFVFVVALFVSHAIASASFAQSEKKKDASAAELNGKAFDTARQAADELIKAAEAFDVSALKEILGPGSDDLVSTDDQVQDKNRAAAFVSMAHEKNAVEVDPKNPNRATLSVGNEDWPLPIPIMKRKGKWYFDTNAGREEVLLRRIGGNELNAIAVCSGFVEAEEEYAEQKHDGSEVNQYAQKIVSTPGKQDGLAWKNPDGTWGGPVGENIAQVIEKGYSADGQGKPYEGYYFKVLKGQGPAAPMGEMDFLVNGAMIGGFALAAAPAEYKVTGVKTFVVSQNGVVYEKDLGPNTLESFKNMDRFNPDRSWHPTKAQPPE